MNNPVIENMLSRSYFKYPDTAANRDANIMEVVALVAMYALTNFINKVSNPDTGLPLVALAARSNPA